MKRGLGRAIGGGGGVGWWMLQGNGFYVGHTGVIVFVNFVRMWLLNHGRLQMIACLKRVMRKMQRRVRQKDRGSNKRQNSKDCEGWVKGRVLSNLVWQTPLSSIVWYQFEWLWPSLTIKLECMYYSVALWHSIASAFAMVDYVRNMTAKKFVGKANVDRLSFIYNI